MRSPEQEEAKTRWALEGKAMIVAAVQDQTMIKYKQKHQRWEAFCEVIGQQDPFLMDLGHYDKIMFVCSWAAWARSTGKWGGHTCIQALSAARTIFIQNLVDHQVFETDTIKSLRRSLNLTDWWDEARQQKEGRIDFTYDMVKTAARRALHSTDPWTVMMSTGIITASFMLLRVGEYGQAPAPNHPDHRIITRNVIFYLRGSDTPVSPQELRRMALSTSLARVQGLVESTSFVLAGSKTDKKRRGVTFSFETKDFDSNDDVNAMAMWIKWACMVDHREDDPFFSFRTNENTERTELSASTITTELRSVAAEHNIPASELYRITPHSIRRGMASHLYNLGMSPTLILQMGRWSLKSSAAPKYQQLGKGCCSQVVNATKQTGQTSGDSIRTLIHSKNFRDQYKASR